MESKPFYKSVTLWGAVATLVGVVETIAAEPMLLKPFVDLGLFAMPGAGKLASILAAGGALTTIWGRVRPGSGAPLTMGK